MYMYTYIHIYIYTYVYIYSYVKAGPTRSSGAHMKGVSRLINQGADDDGAHGGAPTYSALRIQQERAAGLRARTQARR